MAIFKKPTREVGYTKIQEFINRTRQEKLYFSCEYIFLWRKTETRPISVSPWRPSRSSVWEPLP